MAKTESATSSTTGQGIRRTSSRCHNKSPEKPNPVHVPKKSAMTDKTNIQSSKTKLLSCGKSHTKAKKLKENEVKEPVKKHVCTKCGKGFSRRSHLRDHSYTHSGEKPHVCSYCSRQFTLESNLEKHKRIHTGDKRYACNTCEKRFTLKRNMSDHERTHSGKKGFECPLCEQTFTRKSSVIRHKIAKHLNDESYRPRSINVQHLKIHTGKKFECNECLEKFHSKLNLQQHITAKHLRNKFWRQRGCSAIIQPEIVFVDCENQFRDDFTMLSNMTEDNPIDETDFEMKEETGEEKNGESAGLGTSEPHGKKKQLFVHATPIITNVHSVAKVSATTAPKNPVVLLSRIDEIMRDKYKITCRELRVTLERMKISPVKIEEN